MRSMTFADFFRVLLLSKVIWGADFDSDNHFGLRRLEMTSWNHQIIKGQWRHMTRKWFFEFLTPKNYPWAFKNYGNVFYSSQGTRWTLKFCSSSIRSKVIGDHGFRHFSALDLTSEVTGWPRTLSLYINLFVSRRATRSFFPRSSSSIRGETARGGSYQPPLVPWKDAKWPVPARVKPPVWRDLSYVRFLPLLAPFVRAYAPLPLRAPSWPWGARYRAPSGGVANEAMGWQIF